jgi:hypothetical protein
VALEPTAGSRSSAVIFTELFQYSLSPNRAIVVPNWSITDSYTLFCQPGNPIQGRFLPEGSGSHELSQLRVGFSSHNHIIRGHYSKTA